MVKLSQQLQEKEDVQQDIRKTRTERVLLKQEKQKAELEKRRLDELRKQAEKIQEERFKDQIVEEKYTETIPRKYNVNDYTRAKWYNLEGYVRDRWLQNAKINKYKGDWAVDTYTRTRKKTIPFTLDSGENSYKKVYDSLSPELKKFFQSPETIVEEKQKRIVDTKEQIQEKRSYADQKISEIRKTYEDKLRKNQEQFLSKRGSDRVNARESYEKQKREYEDKMEERIRYWQGYKEGLGKAETQLNKGQDIQLKDILNYAEDFGDYQEEKKRASNEQRTFENIKKGEIEALKDAGYTPYIVEKRSAKGSPETTELTFYNKLTGDWKSISTIKTPAKIDITKLQKYGFSAPVQSTFSYLGTDYKYKTSIPLYKDTQRQNEIVSANQRTGITEQMLINQAYGKYMEENYKGDNIFPRDASETTSFKMGDNAYIKTSDIIGFADQGSISTQDQYLEVKGGNIDLKPIDYLGKGDKWISDKIDKVVLEGLKYYGTPKERAEVKDYLLKGEDWIGKKKQETFEETVGLKNIEGVEENLQTEYNQLYQQAFDRKYLKDIMAENIDFETASKEFEQSDEAKKIMEDYGEDYQKEITKLSQGVGLLGRATGGVKLFGLGLGESTLKTIQSPSKTIKTGASIYAGYKILGGLSKISAFRWGIPTAFTGYGAYKFLSPTSTLEEAGGGLITAGIGLGTLGYLGYRWQGTPVTKRVKIKKPVGDFESYPKGYDLKNLKKVVYSDQKISQFGREGYRTVVTTKGRLLSNKFWKNLGVPNKFTNIDYNAVYRGVPTQQLPRVYKIEGFGKSFTTTFGKKSGYQKAFDLLRKYGWSEAEARATLRYTAPRIYEGYSAGLVEYGGSRSRGSSINEIRQKVIDIDKNLGIKTRGGSTIRTETDFQRALVKTIDNKNVFLEAKTSDIYRVTNTGKKTFLRTERELSRGIGIASDTKRGYDLLTSPTSDKSLINLYKDITYKDVASATKTLLKGSARITSKDYKFDIEINPRIAEKSRAVIIDKTGQQNLEKIYITSNNIEKTPLSKTFSNKELINEIIKKTNKIKVTPTKNIIEEVENIDKTTKYISQDKYFGSGMYERTQEFGGSQLTPTQIKLQDQLKLIDTPQIKVSRIKNIIDVKPQVISGNIFASSITTASLLNLGFKNKLDVKTNLLIKNLIKEDTKVKTNLLIKNLIKEDTKVKTNLSTTVKTTPALRSQLKSLLELNTPVLSKTPTFKPQTPEIQKPIIPKPFIIPFLNRNQLIKQKLKEKKKKGELAYLPDFTSRSLGLKAETITEKQAQKKLNKLLTGLEIRRPVKIKWQ